MGTSPVPFCLIQVVPAPYPLSISAFQVDLVGLKQTLAFSSWLLSD
jgi:hypothetical protein